MGIYSVPGGGTVFTAATTDWAHGLVSGNAGGGGVNVLANASGPLGPGHNAEVFEGGNWNILHGHFVGRVVDENGKPLPQQLTVEFGASEENAAITNWGKAPQASLRERIGTGWRGQQRADERYAVQQRRAKGAGRGAVARAAGREV